MSSPTNTLYLSSGAPILLPSTIKVAVRALFIKILLGYPPCDLLQIPEPDVLPYLGAMSIVPGVEQKKSGFIIAFSSTRAGRVVRQITGQFRLKKTRHSLERGRRVFYDDGMRWLGPGGRTARPTEAQTCAVNTLFLFDAARQKRNTSVSL